MQRLFVKGGKPTEEADHLNDVNRIKKDVRYRIDNEVRDEEKRFENPHLHYFDMSPKMYQMKLQMLDSHGAKIE